MIQQAVGADAHIGPALRALPANEGGCGHPPLRRKRLNRNKEENG